MFGVIHHAIDRGTCLLFFFFFFSSRRRHTRYWRDWSSDVCSSDLCTASARAPCRQRRSHRSSRANPRARNTASVTVITRDEIEARQSVTLTDLLLDRKSVV